jgi:hypothetical protein
LGEEGGDAVAPQVGGSDLVWSARYDLLSGQNATLDVRKSGLD